jgi:large subunit ribosomal protein L17
MRHRKTGRKLGRNASHRKALFRNMVTSLLEHGRIVTTEAKAKELRRYAAKMITLGKRDTLHSRRIAAQTIRSQAVLVKLFDEIAPGFAQREGGYTRIAKLGPRKGDNAPMSVIELMPAGAPQLKNRKKPVTVAPTKVAVPDSKEVFEAPSEEKLAEPVEAAAEEAPAAEAVAEEAPAAEAVAEEAPAAEAVAEEAPAAEAVAEEEGTEEKKADEDAAE